MASPEKGVKKGSQNRSIFGPLFDPFLRVWPHTLLYVLGIGPIPAQRGSQRGSQNDPFLAFFELTGGYSPWPGGGPGEAPGGGPGPGYGQIGHLSRK